MRGAAVPVVGKSSGAVRPALQLYAQPAVRELKVIAYTAVLRM